MTAYLVGRDLLFGSRIAAAATEAGVEIRRVDSPAALPPSDEVSLLLVDWSEREPDWGAELAAWRQASAHGPRLILFGPHTDLGAHAEAKRHGIGPMWARSKLVASLSTLF